MQKDNRLHEFRTGFVKPIVRLSHLNVRMQLAAYCTAQYVCLQIHQQQSNKLHARNF